MLGQLGERLEGEYREAMFAALTAPGCARERLREALRAICAVDERDLGVLGALSGGGLDPVFNEPGTSDTPVLTRVGLVAFFVCIAGIGVALDAPFSTTIVLGQAYLPRRVALSSGITYRLVIGLGGLAATALGALADATSVTAVLGILPLLALAALGLSASLPRTPVLSQASPPPAGAGGSSPAAA